MDSAALFLLFFGCFGGLLVLGLIFALFAAIFSRRRGYGPGGYYGRPRPFFGWFFDPFRPRFGPRPGEFYRREHFEHEHHHHYHHDGGGHHGGHHGGGGHHR